MYPGVKTAVVIDADSDARFILRVALSGGGFRVHEAATGAEGVEAVRDLRPALVVLDVEAPGIGGSETLRRIRTISDACVLLVSGSADEADHLLGLAAGADDFVTKPFSPCDIRSHVSDLFRRTRPVRESFRAAGIPVQRRPGPTQSDVIRHGPLTVDTASRCAWLLDSELPLTGTEFDLLRTLAGNPCKVWQPPALLAEVRDGARDQHSVEVGLGNLRRKLGEAVPGGARMIVTVRGAGYRLAPVHTLPPALSTAPDDEMGRSLMSRIGEFSAGRW
jgi:DNA-binding response OmpR family regulator